MAVLSYATNKKFCISAAECNTIYCLSPAKWPSHQLPLVGLIPAVVLNLTSLPSLTSICAPAVNTGTVNATGVISSALSL